MSRYLAVVMLSLLMVFVAGGTAMADGHPDFSGTWELDLDAPGSTSMGDLLATQGASWLERKSVDNVEVTQKITQTEKALTIAVDGAGMSKTNVLALDGSPEMRDTERMGKVETRSSWDSDGKTLVTVMKYKTTDGKNAEWTTRRYLSDEGKTLNVDHLLKTEDGKTMTAKRILRKK